MLERLANLISLLRVSRLFRSKSKGLPARTFSGKTPQDLNSEAATMQRGGQ